MGPLAGLKVIDLTSGVMGPYATQFLGDFGADVIKVEAPVGDLVRSIGSGRHPDMGPMFLNSNRSKRSISINLKSPEGKALLLAAMSDDLVKRGLKAGDLIKAVAPHVDGRGGGKPQLAQAGGSNPGGIPQALDAARAWLTERLSG